MITTFSLKNRVSWRNQDLFHDFFFLSGPADNQTHLSKMRDNTISNSHELLKLKSCKTLKNFI